MQSRYALRFENGERQGETVPITGTGITIGRKPGNSVQILDASVSGRHAEFLLEGEQVLLRDLGSTNGSRVGGERVSERQLAHADQVMLGNVRLVLLDTTRAAPAPSSAEPELEQREPARASEATVAGDSVRTISADKVVKAGKRSLVGALVGAVVVLGAGGGAWWFLGQGPAESGGAALRAVEPVAGDLLRGPYSFEGDGAAWENDESSSAAFDLDSGSRRSGATGLGVELSAGQWALARSGAIKLGTQRSLEVLGFARADGGAQARLGLEFESSSGASARSVAWTAAASEAEFAELRLAVTIPMGFDTLRVVALARAADGEGSVDLDDVALVQGAEQPAEALEEFRLFAHGQPANVATLFKIDRSLASDIHVRTAGGALGERATLNVAKLANGFGVQVGAGSARKLVFRVDEPLLKGGLASTGSGGYRAHTGEFTREGCTAVVAGAGKDQVRWVFTAPLLLRGQPDGTGIRVEAELGDASSIVLQTEFRAERDAAQALARTARESEKSGQLGVAAQEWSRLRDEFPFESALLTEAETARARIGETGLGEVRALRAEVERARFFRLVDLYRQCRRSAENIAARYSGIDVESDARALVAAVDAELVTLEVELQRHERTRLEGIAQALDTGGSAALAQHVREYLEQHFAGVSNASSGGR
ncbi:MAG: FHA domain-containing protein [Planctomycetes bacterium]|nr:FHA domain-containing protein [Planctomycetota bacterium]